MKITEDLHGSLVRALGGDVLQHSSLRQKPLSIDLALPLPPRLRVYMYKLVVGGPRRAGEYKVLLRVPGQVRGEYGSFDHSEDRFALVMGYDPDLDVFVLWDASLHARFKWAGNIQVRAPTVYTAAAMGHAREVRPLTSGLTEVVIACRSAELPQTIDDRVLWTGDNTVRP